MSDAPTKLDFARLRRREHRTTVGKLRKLIENVRDDVIVVVPSQDHSFRNAGVQLTTIRESPSGHMFEDGDYDLDAGDEQLDALLVS